MEIDADKLLIDAVRDGIREGIKSKMGQSYANPFDDLLRSAIAEHGAAIKALISGAIGACLGDEQFRANVAEQVRHIVAKQLVQKFGGELEKTVNQLKSDPATRARITLAIEEIVRPKA